MKVKYPLFIIPHRTFYIETGDLYVGDVGQDDLEEVDVVVAGGNYGWNIKEGSFCFEPNGPDPGFAFDQDTCPDEPPGLIDPLAEFEYVLLSPCHEVFRLKGS